MFKEIKQLGTKLEKQISKTNVLGKEPEELKQENLFLKTELKLQLDNIKLTISSSNNNKDTNILKSKSNSGSIKPQSTIISNISHGTLTVPEQNPGYINYTSKSIKIIIVIQWQTFARSNYSNTISGNAS